MPFRMIDLAKRVFRRSARHPVRVRLTVEGLEDRTVPTTVTVARVSDAVEGGAGGLFQFTRTGDTGQELTVYYTVNTTGDRVATPGADYVVLSGTATFAVGSSTADLPVTWLPDNEFEDTEEVRITLVAPPSGTTQSTTTQSTTTQYTPGGETAQVVTITDNPPQVSATVVWEQVGSEIGRVTLTRSGGDLNQPLTTWFEVEGTVEDEGETLTVVLGAAADFPAGDTTLTIPIIADPSTGGLANAQMPGARQPPVRGDRSQQLQLYRNALDDPTTEQFRATVIINLPEALDNLPSPITYAELLVLKSIRAKLQSMDPAVFPGPEDRARLLNKTAAKIERAAIEWRMTTEAIIAQAIASQSGIVAGLITLVGDRAAVEQTVDALAAQLGAADYYDREAAQEELNIMFGRYLFLGDFSRATIAMNRLLRFARDSQNPEIEFRTREIATVANKVVRYLSEKQQEYLRVTGGP